MDGVSSVLPLLVRVAEMRKVRGKSITIEEDGVLWIDCTNGSIYSVIEGYYANVVWISRPGR